MVNRSRVIPARLLGRRPGGGAAEILLVRRLEDDTWQAVLRPARRLREGQRIEVGPGFEVQVEDAPSPAGLRRVRLLVATGDVRGALQRWGHTPLPPYIRRPDGAADRERYQNVYAREEGSIAAPTAGLHFTPGLFERLALREVQRVEIVLHVGPGTFCPITVPDVRRHKIAPEAYEIPTAAVDAIRRTRARGGRVVAVGTTTTRTLETAAQAGDLQPGAGWADLVIVPGFRFRVVDALITNFHLPRSSLLVLAAAFAGRQQVLAAYGEALARGYRFASYGDAMLIV